MAFESGVMPEDWRSAVIVPLYKGKGERTECIKYRGTSLYCGWKDILLSLKKRGLDVRQARRMIQDRSEWLGFVRGDSWGIPWEMNP